MGDRLVEYRGAVHIHSRYSDGSGSLRTIIAAARHANLDFVIVTDHNTLRAKRDGWEGWHDGVLVVVGVEISPYNAGHCLALDVRHCAGFKAMSAPKYLASIQAQGGLAFLAHPQGKTIPLFGSRVEAWPDWDLDSFTGIEAWSYMHNWVDGLSLRNLWAALRRPGERVSGPAPEILKRWDDLGRRRRVVAIAGLDVHAKRLPLTWMRVFSYGYLFHTLRTHVLCPPFSGDFQEDRIRLRQALELGRCFLANDLLADSTGFVFQGRISADQVAPMGSEVPWRPGFTLEVVSPHPATIRFLCDGEVLSIQEGREAATGAPRPGVYRAEALLSGRSWVFSNPLYLR